VDVATALALDLRGQLAHERDRRRPGRDRVAEQRCNVDALEPARRRDRLGGRERDQPLARLGARERGLEVEHALDEGLGREERRDLRAGEEGRPHRLKNAVSPSPCSLISQR
jgi:hypothetical protein